MSPEDPRHGRVAGYRAGCTEQCCRDAVNKYNQMRLYRRAQGIPSNRTDVTGSVRRLQALHALGWSTVRIAAVIGVEPTHLNLMRRRAKYVYAHTAEAIKRAYDDMSMTLPPQNTPSDRMSVGRTRELAKRRGWLPPLAWDDDEIDDPTARPVASRCRRTTYYSSADLLDEFEHLTGMGVSEHQATRQLGVTLGAIEKARGRAA